MILIMVATSALTALLFHLPFFSSLTLVWRVLCCAVLCCAVVCCAVLCCAVLSGVEQLHLDLFSNFKCVRFFRLHVITLRGSCHGKQKNDDKRMYLTLG